VLAAVNAGARWASSDVQEVILLEGASLALEQSVRPVLGRENELVGVVAIALAETFADHLVGPPFGEDRLLVVLLMRSYLRHAGLAMCSGVHIDNTHRCR
jgi:hypothetical protein